ncbi:helicase-related protein [Halobacillus sp. ACCC02827]|uniref:DEAD/DEAH box helicase n=1 Tax=Halobacillus sp. ACCC02827 TaxID=3052090 RepID=UPI00256FEF80|nr:helicase-related protein [Halobacillus sp. ACCC02827]WJE15752.1 helicase-related protein [Halobacillus sp. ACCC02827]
MLESGAIIRGTQFPETVEVKKAEKLDDQFFLLEAIGRDSNQYYELLLDEKEIYSLEQLNSDSEKDSLTTEDIQHFIQYYALRNEKQYNQSRSLGNKNLIPLPHQIEAVYGRMLQTPQVRFLLADDPGAGKTIMAGMLIKELKARLSVSRILILVPPLVLRQWQEELDEKFDESFHIINRSVVREYGSKNPFVTNDNCLASMYWASRDDIKSLINEADFDLIIVDEAHKMAAYTNGVLKRKTRRTRLYQLGESILHKAEHSVLLTATPHKGDMENFRHLMRLLDDDIFSDISANESLKEKSNPFIIRRLKESMKNFDGTPIFPKRTTKTIQYKLSDQELNLYNQVTDYVREHFNRAMNNGSNSTAFAMMLLQRRLSSSIEAIHVSLKRRKMKLENLLDETIKDRKKYLNKLKKFNLEDYEEESLETKEQIENQLLDSIDDVDPEELKIEIAEINNLIDQSTFIRNHVVERKYRELEETLFGMNGLLKNDEKILIFTESKDTLKYLERRLLERVPSVAKIIGDYSMDERRKQVSQFKNESQIMLATDAGGESINLQFCNQMVNYDIPWNPNRLEQRMGRIHRIGQNNEVFSFNLVAENTREGNVMVRLIEKLERMRTDLGSDLVYDFIGDVLEDRYDSLSNLMQDAILNREKLNEIINDMEKALSQEHAKLLKLVQDEKVDENTIDLPHLKREHNDVLVQRLPTRSYVSFIENIFKSQNIKVYESSEGFVKRIERFPKYIREMAMKENIQLDFRESMKFTGFQSYESSDVKKIDIDSPLLQLGMNLTKKKLDQIALKRYKVSYPINEPLVIEGYQLGIKDGEGSLVKSELIFLARRENGEVTEIDPYWLFQHTFSGEISVQEEEKYSILRPAALKKSIEIRDELKYKRKEQLSKMKSFLEKTYRHQYDTTLQKLGEYQLNNTENKNNALINQMNAKLVDIENKKEDRLSLIKRQENIIMAPPKRLIQLEVIPNGRKGRLISTDYKDIIENFEQQNGRSTLKAYKPLGLVDFYSERFNGEERFIILTDTADYVLSEEHIEDLRDIQDRTYIYMVKGTEIIDVIKLSKALFIV